MEKGQKWKMGWWAEVEKRTQGYISVFKFIRQGRMQDLTLSRVARARGLASGDTAAVLCQRGEVGSLLREAGQAEATKTLVTGRALHTWAT